MIPTQTKLALICAASALATAVPSFAQGSIASEGNRRTFETTSVQRIAFQPGGTIRVKDSYGYLAVDGWDEPEVEITLIRSSGFYEPEEKEEILERFGAISVVAEKGSDKELEITTTLPRRRHRSVIPPFRTTTHEDVTLEYRIHVPRDSRLTLRHDYGYVWVSDLTGELDLRSHTGDMILMLPDPGPYSLNSRTAMGTITSDFVGKGRNRFLVGNSLAYAGDTAGRKIFLRMGRGSITIKNGPPMPPYGKN